MADRNSFRKKKSKVVFKLTGDEKDRKKEISFNDHDRSDYLTGFHRRKVARREFAEQRIAEKEKEEIREQKKLAKLQRESYRESIIQAKMIGEGKTTLAAQLEKESENQDDDDEEEEETTTTSSAGSTKKSKTSVIEPSTQQFKNDTNIITATIEPISFDDEEEEENGDKQGEEDDSEEDENEQDSKNKDKYKVKKKENKFKDKKKKDQITSDKLTVLDATKKIFLDDKGRKVMMKKEKGKLIPIILTEAAEERMEKGWALPRQLREKPKKSWSLTEARKSRKKTRKEKK